MLDAYVFGSQSEVRALSDEWLLTYNDNRPQRSSLAFTAEIVRAFPLQDREGPDRSRSEFPLVFVLRLRELGIKHRYIGPRGPQQIGKVERSHRTDSEEF